MEVNQEKMDNQMTKSLNDSNEESLIGPTTTTAKDINNKENQLVNDIDDQKSDQSLFDMIKSRPKRLNRKVPSRLQPINRPNSLINKETNIDYEKKPNQSSAKPLPNSSLDFGLDAFFQSSSVTLKKRTFADFYPVDEVSFRPLTQTSKSNDHSNDRNNNNKEMNNNHENKEDKLCPLSIADKIARSRSSPNLIDPRKMLLPGDPRHNLSMIKELRSRQKSGESTEISQNNNNNLNHHSSLLSELKAKNKPFCIVKDSPSLVHKEKPPISLLKPSLKTLSASSSGSSSLTSSSVQQSGQFFNVKLRETKSNKVNNLIKSYTRASFPVNSETDSDSGKMKRNSEPVNCNQDNQQKEEKKVHSDSVSGVEDDKRLSKEASALNGEQKTHRSSGESSSSEEDDDDEDEEEKEEADGKKEDDKDDNCHQNGTKSQGNIFC